MELQASSVFVPVSMPSPAMLKRPSTPSALGFGLEFAQGNATGETNLGVAPPTPTNSSRRDSNGTRLMMPRSSRSMRHNVLQARNAEEIDSVPLPLPPQLSVRPATSSSTPSGGLQERRAAMLGVTTLGSDVMQNSVSTWVTAGLCTPKNTDRRDMARSVDQMIPLWRGSAADVLIGGAVVRSPVAMLQSPPQASSPVYMVASPQQGLHGYPRADAPLPMAVSPMMTCTQAPSLGEDASMVGAMAPFFLGTPTNAERANATDGARVMMPRSAHSIRNRFFEGSSADAAVTYCDALDASPLAQSGGRAMGSL